MRNLQNIIVAALFTMFVPSAAFAQSALSDDLDDMIAQLSVRDESISADMALLTSGTKSTLGDAPGHRPGDGRGPKSGPRPGSNPPPPPSRHHAAPPPPPAPRPHHSHHYEAHPVLLEAVAAAPIPEDDRYTIGLGLRGFGSYVSDTEFGGGAGWYFKIRPIRWISIEFVNDYIFNPTSRCADDMLFRVPMYLDLQAHVFDYGNLDLYGLVGGGISLILPDNYYGPRQNSIVQGGLQLGGGISFLVSGFEIGFDARYTYEYQRGTHRDQHGVILSLNIGLAR